MKRLISGFIFIFCFCCCRFLFSQTPEITFKQISTHEGLSSGGVLAITKDNQGLIWFGTTSGLNRYDGYEFRVFVNDPTNPKSISDNWINCLLVSRTGEFWIGTQNGGLNLFDPQSEKFISYKNNPKDNSSLASNNVRALYEDNDGTLWIATRGGGLCRKKPGDKKFIHFRNNPSDAASISSDIVHYILRDSHGVLWIGTANGIDRLQESRGSFVKFIHYKFISPKEMSASIPTKNSYNDKSSIHKSVLAIYEDRYGNLFIGAGDRGLFKYDRSNDDFVKYSPWQNSKIVDDNYWVESIHEDREGRLWAGTWNDGLKLIDEKVNAVYNYRYDENDLQSLCSDDIFSIYEDDAGGMWLGTDKGISIYDNNKKPFINYLHDRNNPSSISGGGVSQLCMDTDGGLWIAIPGSGLDYLPKGSNKFIHFKHDLHNSSSLSSNDVVCVSSKSKDIVWIGTQGSGIDQLNKRTKKFKHFTNNPKSPNSISENTIFDLFEDHKGDLWIGTVTKGVDKLEPSTGKIIHYGNRPGDSTSFSGECVWSFFEDKRGNVWIGTKSAGLNRFDRKSNKFTCYKNNPNDPHSISSNYVQTIHEDSKGIIWIGTTNGLNRFNESTNNFTVYTTRDGLADNRINAILDDKQGCLWIAFKGLTAFDPNTKIYKHFDRSDGILCGNFNQDAACMGKGGKMYFGADEGLLAFYPESMHNNNYAPPIVLTSFKVFEKPFPIPGDYKKVITLSYDENYFSFEFAALSFTASEKNQYRYKLEGVDKNWVNCGTRRYAAYTHIEPGNYIFRVQGCNNDGLWNHAGIAIPIHIIPPFWKTWWFSISSVIVILFAVVFSFYRRLEFHKKQTRAQQELSKQLLEYQEKERQRIGRSLHDSLEQNLLVVKNLAVIGLEADKDKKSSNQQLDEISALSSEILSEVREIAYDLRPYHLDQLGLTGAIRSILLRVSSSTKISFTQDIDDIDNLFPKQQEINVFRIIQEAVNNIVKHSRASCAAVQIKREKNNVIFTVSDNGIGFDNSRQGFGLTGMNERVRIIGGTLTIKSTAGAGTSVAAVIPVEVK